jgi:uncharacterized protein (DUF1778 family)
MATTRDTLNLRIKPELRELIDRAAEDALLDRTVFGVSPKAYAEFLKRLDAAPQPNDCLRRTMQARGSWDRV